MKMNRPLISVIVPVYNVERYISRCVDSILAQTYENLEIILIDDGSTDASGRICEAYKERDARIRTIHRSNGGMSAARNAGIQAAGGAYISFVDSDDYIAEDLIAYLYHLASSNCAQISVCGYQKLYEGSGYAAEPIHVEPVTVCGSENALSMLLYQNGIIASVWGKLFQGNLFQAVRFPEGRWHEDVAVMYRLLDSAEVIAIGTETKYFYVQRQGSITNSDFDIRRMDYIRFTAECMAYMRARHPDLEQAAVSRHFSACFELLAAMGKERKHFQNEYDRLVREIKAYRRVVLADPSARAVNRAAAMGTFLMPVAVLQKLSRMMKRP